MRCKNCKDKFEPKKFNWKWCNKEECNNVGVSETLSKARKQIEKKKRLEKAKAKNELLTHTDYLKILQTAFNSYIRKRDEGLPCVSCGRHINKTNTHASHYFSVGAYPNLRFNEDNVHSSCNYCNLHLHGNIAEYSIRLPKKIGIERFEALKNSRTEPLKLTIPEIKQLINKYKLEVKKMNK